MLSVNYEHNEVDVGTCQSCQELSVEVNTPRVDTMLHISGRFKMDFLISTSGVKCDQLSLFIASI